MNLGSVSDWKGLKVHFMIQSLASTPSFSKKIERVLYITRYIYVQVENILCQFTLIHPCKLDISIHKDHQSGLCYNQLIVHTNANLNIWKFKPSWFCVGVYLLNNNSILQSLKWVFVIKRYQLWYFTPNYCFFPTPVLKIYFPCGIIITLDLCLMLFA